MTFSFNRMRVIMIIAITMNAFPLISCTPKAAPVNSSNSSKNISVSSSMDDEILGYINRYRQSKGLGALKMEAVISNEARKHSQDMAKRKTAFGHDGFEGRVKSISKQLGVMRASAENVAYGQMSAKDVVDGWIHSPGHRRNIEGKYSMTGIGVVKANDGTLFYTQIFTTK